MYRTNFVISTESPLIVDFHIPAAIVGQRLIGVTSASVEKTIRCALDVLIIYTAFVL